jgi:hypothetical protein
MGASRATFGDVKMAQLLFDKDILSGTINGVRYEREDKTDSYVEIPPAFIITDSDGAAWTFGPQFAEHHGEYEFSVMRNDVDTGEVAKRIVYQRGVVCIFGSYGWKRFSRNRRHFI